MTEGTFTTLYSCGPYYVIIVHLCGRGMKYRDEYVASHSQYREWALLSFHSVCLSVWMSAGHSATYSLPRLIDHNQIWSAGIYLSSDPCKPFWIPYFPHLGARGKNIQNFAYFQHIDSGSCETLLVLQFVIKFANIWAQYSPSTYASTHIGFFDLCPNVQMAAL